jgi:hypothetical protein
MVRGDSKSFNVFVTRENPTTGVDEVVNLTGAKAWFTAKATSVDTDSDAVFKKNSVDNPTKVIITAITGVIRINIDPGDTEGYPYRWLVYDCQVKEADGTLTTVQRGKLELLTRATISTT